MLTGSRRAQGIAVCVRWFSAFHGKPRCIKVPAAQYRDDHTVLLVSKSCIGPILVLTPITPFASASGSSRGWAHSRHEFETARLPSWSQSDALLRLLFAKPASRNICANSAVPRGLLYLSAHFRIAFPQAKTLESGVSEK